MLTATAGCAEPGKIKGKNMEDQLEKLVAGYRDLYFAPNDERKSELEDKLSELDWRGEFLAAPAIVDASIPGIPILALNKRSDLREWEVNLRSNGFVISNDIERGETWVIPLYKPPEKRLKPQPKTKGPKPEPGDGSYTGVVRRVVGESQIEPLHPGEYAVTLVTWDHLSNTRRIRKEGDSKHVEQAISFVSWPWNSWLDKQAFMPFAASPKMNKEEGIALILDGEKADRKIIGSLIAKARPMHLISPDPKRAAFVGIQAGIHVDLILFTLDLPPQVVRIDVPILGSSPIKVGDEMKGYFNLPFPFEPSTEDRMLYAVASGKVIGPVKVPGEKP
jgi:hypothetical protein